jgi:hypothetical protein
LDILTDTKKEPRLFAEILEGVGGTVDHLVATIIKHFSRACERPNHPEIDKYASSCMRFMVRHGDDDLYVALRSSEFLASIVTTLSPCMVLPQRSHAHSF